MYGYPRRAVSYTREIAGSATTDPMTPRSPHVEVGSPSRSKLCRYHPKPQEAAQEGQMGVASRNSFETSSAGTQSNSGVPLSDTDTASSSFAVRARQAGIPDWNEKVAKGLVGNNSVFDGRWVLNPDEAWNVPSRENSGQTTSPKSPSSVHSARSAVTEESSSPSMLGPLRVDKQLSQETLLPIKDNNETKSQADLAESEQLDLDDNGSCGRGLVDNIEGSSESLPGSMNIQ